MIISYAPPARQPVNQREEKIELQEQKVEEHAARKDLAGAATAHAELDALKQSFVASLSESKSALQREDEFVAQVNSKRVKELQAQANDLASKKDYMSAAKVRAEADKLLKNLQQPLPAMPTGRPKLANPFQKEIQMQEKKVDLYAAR